MDDPAMITTDEEDVVAKITSPGSSAVLAVDVGRSFTNYLGAGMESPEGFPSRAARIEDAPRTMSGGLMEGGIDLGDDGTWITALPPRTHHESLHHDTFFKTAAYKALVFEAMARSKLTKIGLLVLGLPTFYFADASKEELVAAFAGTFEIRGQSYTVDRVKVLDQAIGAAPILTDAKGPKLDYGDRLILDFGLRTTDAAVVTPSWTIKRQYSMSSGIACHDVCERASASLHPVKVDAEEIDARLRSGEMKFTMGKVDIDLQAAVDKAAAEVTPEIVAEITGKYRNFDDIGAIILAGGGAPIFERPFTEAFADHETITVVALEDPATANVRGFFMIGEQFLASVA